MPYENAGSGHAYPEGHAAFFLVDYMCSCDYVRTDSPESHGEVTVARLKRKAKEKGWTRAKLERAQADALAAAEKRPSRGLNSALHPDILELIEGQLQSSPYVELILHFHSGGVIEAEEFKLVAEQQLHYGALAELSHIERDTRYRIVPDA